jgi:hypothetical protein
VLPLDIFYAAYIFVIALCDILLSLEPVRFQKSSRCVAGVSYPLTVMHRLVVERENLMIVCWIYHFHSV